MSPINRGIIKHSTSNASLSSCPFPALRDGYILVKTVAVALNPTDNYSLHVEPTFAAQDVLLGCDFSGIVLDVGKGVKKSFTKGDRVAGMAFGGMRHSSKTCTGK